MNDGIVDVTDMFSRLGCEAWEDPDLDADIPGPFCMDCDRHNSNLRV